VQFAPAPNFRVLPHCFVTSFPLRVEKRLNQYFSFIAPPLALVIPERCLSFNDLAMIDAEISLFFPRYFALRDIAVQQTR